MVRDVAGAGRIDQRTVDTILAKVAS